MSKKILLFQTRTIISFNGSCKTVSSPLIPRAGLSRSARTSPHAILIGAHSWSAPSAIRSNPVDTEKDTVNCRKKIKIQQIAADIEFCRDWESFPAIFVEASPRYIVTKLPLLDSVLMRNASPGPLNDPRGVFLIVRTKVPIHIYFNLMRARISARLPCFYPVIIFVQYRHERADPTKSIEIMQHIR